MREEIEQMKKEVKEIHEESLAMSLLKDYKIQNKRLFISLITVLIMWFATIGLFGYYIFNYTYEEEIITETAEVENENGNANACVGDNCNNGVINGESESN